VLAARDPHPPLRGAPLARHHKIGTAIPTLSTGAPRPFAERLRLLISTSRFRNRWVGAILRERFVFTERDCV